MYLFSNILQVDVPTDLTVSLSLSLSLSFEVRALPDVGSNGQSEMAKGDDDDDGMTVEWRWRA